MTSGFRASCIITCYNYERYVAEAIQSAISQQLPFSEIVVVNDASTDRSAQAIESVITGHANCRLVNRRENGGQLRSFESGVAATTGEWVFFLDADDFFSPEWLSAVSRVLEEDSNTDFLFSSPKPVDAHLTALQVFPPSGARPPAWRDMGYTLIKTYALSCFVGSPTSALCLSRRLLSELFPARWHDDFRTRADDWLVFGASLLGRRKLFVQGDYVAYRRHGSNSYASNPVHGRADVLFARQLALHRMWRYFEDRAGFDARFMSQAYLEFKTHPEPDYRELMDYLKIVMRAPPILVSRRRAVAVMLKHFIAASNKTDRKSD